MTNPSDEKPKTIGGMALGWWNSLQPGDLRDGRRRGNPGALARLRRADLFGAASEEVTFELFQRLHSHSRGERLGNGLVERATLIAAVLAHVREHDGRRSVASTAGEKNGDQRALHPLRLRRLFAARDAVECLSAFRRLVALLGKRVNVADLAESLFEWPDEIAGDRRRTRWAFDYYGAGSMAPNGDQDQAAA